MAQDKTVAKMISNCLLGDLTPGKVLTVVEFCDRLLKLNRIIPSFSPLSTEGAELFRTLVESRVEAAKE